MIVGLMDSLAMEDNEPRNEADGHSDFFHSLEII